MFQQHSAPRRLPPHTNSLGLSPRSWHAQSVPGKTRTAQKSPGMTSPPRLVLKARQVVMLIWLLIERTLPSSITTLTMPPVCRLRAATMGGLLAVGTPVHGGFGAWLTQYDASFITSGKGLLGAR